MNRTGSFQLTLFCSIVVILIAVTALIGWGIDLPALRAISSTIPALTPATALLLLLLAGGLIGARSGMQERTESSIARVITRWMAGTVLLGSCAFAVLYMFGLTSRLDVLFFTEKVLAEGGLYPGRPSPQTITTTFLLGVSLLFSLSSRRRFQQAALLIAGGAFVLPWLALFGYASSSSEFYALEVAPKTGISILTAISCILVVLGVMGLQDSRGPMGLLKTRSAGGILMRWLLPITLVVPLIVAWYLLWDSSLGAAEISRRLALSWGIASILISFVVLRYGFLLQQYEDSDQQRAELKRLSESLTKSNEELDRFVHAASHDLKAPLISIKYFAQAIYEDSYDQLPETSREDLTRVINRVGRMEALIYDLLEYARIGREEAPRVKVDTYDLTKELVEFLGPPPELNIEISRSLPTMTLAKTPFSQVMRNLISNAIKHHNRPDGHIWVRASDEGSSVRFEVEDDGPGIDPRYHSKVFEMFEVLSARNDSTGSGLGLAMVKKTIEAHGGGISLDSDVGKGVRMAFTWPRNSVSGTTVVHSTEA